MWTHAGLNECPKLAHCTAAAWNAALASWTRHPNEPPKVAVGPLGRWSDHPFLWIRRWSKIIRRPPQVLSSANHRKDTIHFFAGWWLGTFFSIQLGIPTDFHSIIFQRGCNHQPVCNVQYLLSIVKVGTDKKHWKKHLTFFRRRRGRLLFKGSDGVQPQLGDFEKKRWPHQEIGKHKFGTKWGPVDS